MRHHPIRAALITIGTLCVIVGLVALLIPILPTTPFLLVAAACFARSSDRFYGWLLANRWFGPLIRNYREKGGMTRRQKGVSLGVFLPAITLSATFTPIQPWAKITLAAVAVGVSAYILWGIKTVSDDAS